MVRGVAAGVASHTDGQILHNLLLFGRLLRRLGMDVHAGRMLDSVHVLENIGLRRRSEVRAALRTLLVHRREDLPVFDEAFSVFWRQRKDQTFTLDLRSMGEQRRYRRVEAGPPPLGQHVDAAESEDHASAETIDRVDISRTFNAREVLQTRDFSEFTPSEMAEARQFMDALEWNPGTRRSRRTESGAGYLLDLRRMLREGAQYGGELLKLRHRQRKERPRKLVVICDVSGSMERYTRMLLNFVHSLYGGLQGRVEAFLFATRLTRVTKQFQQRDIDRAVGDVATTVLDWSGGTRIGMALKEFNFKWARRTLGWGSIVLVVSDGWDRGDPELLGQEMERLQRSCRRLIWLSPLAGDENFEPLTQGLRAAMPYVDNLLPVHNLAALLDLARYLNALPEGAPQRQQRPRPVAGERLELKSAAPVQRSWHRGANPTFRHPLWGQGR